ncbi:hypothetical protein Tco_0510155, partial [Tanacetum coccineum]
MAPIALSDTK